MAGRPLRCGGPQKGGDKWPLEAQSPPQTGGSCASSRKSRRSSRTRRSGRSRSRETSRTTPGNTLWRSGRLSGVVDWTQASWGPASIDLEWMRWNLGLRPRPRGGEAIPRDPARAHRERDRPPPLLGHPRRGRPRHRPRPCRPASARRATSPARGTRRRSARAALSRRTESASSCASV
ncbi:MAG: phosphotransferase [Thermoleophilaceae bacterium]